MLTLDHTEVGKMTGRKLLETLGHNWVGDHHNSSFCTTGGEWHVYQTQGRGRQSGRFYVHIWQEIEVAVVDHEGQDTGYRHKGYFHLRGTTYDRVADFQEVA